MKWFLNNSLYLFLLAGVIFTFFWLLQFRKKLKINALTALIIAILAELLGVVAVKCFAALENPGEVNPFAGVSLFGGVFFMPLFFLAGTKLTKRKLEDVFDILAVALVFTMLCARINCLITGCCQGYPIPNTNGLRWPTREAEIAYYLVFIFITAPKVVASKTNGSVYPLYMLSYGIFRFFVEFFRTSSNSDNIIHISHIWAVVSFCIGFAFYLEQHNRSKGGRYKYD